MNYLIVLLLAVIAGELLWLIQRPEDGRGTPASPEREPESAEFERKWREGLDAMMGYDLTTARNAVRGDEDENA